MKLKLYSDRRFLPVGIAHEPIFAPFWGIPLENLALPGAVYYEAFDRYCQMGQSLFEMTTLEAADVVVFPGNLERVFCPEYLSLATALAEQAELAGKPTLGFFWGDCSDKSLPVACNIVFRNSLYRCSKRTLDFAYPSWTVDFTETYFNGAVPIRQKTKIPVIGFCGFVDRPNIKRSVKQLLHQARRLTGRRVSPPHYIGHLLRDRALTQLSQSRQVKPNILLRDHMGFVGQSPDTYQNYRREYVKNLEESDYVLCCRGYGNYSFRLYETLSCGRIPVFIDTDCVLPYDSEIDWQKYTVWVAESELPLIADKIAEFHDRLSPQDFIDLQYECRILWQQNLSPEGFFANLYRQIIHLLYDSGCNSKPIGL